MKINAYLIKRAIKALITKKQDAEYEDLPTDEPLITEKPADEIMVVEEDLIPLKEELYKKAMKVGESYDYDVTRIKDPIKFLNNLIFFYLLASDKKIRFNLEGPIKQIKDPSHHVELFTARRFQSGGIIESEIEEEVENDGIF